MTNFDEYKILGEPDKTERAKLWETAIGLQQADGLRVSDYLIETAKAHIDGDITIEEVKRRIDAYYGAKPSRDLAWSSSYKVIDTINTQNDTMTDTIFSLIKSNTNITTTEIAEQLGLGIATVKRKTKELKDKGWLERVGSIQSGSWKIIKA